MKTKSIAFFLVLCMLVGLLTAPVSAAADDAALRTVRALGIMTGHADGSMDLYSNVTRAQFAKMMTAASQYRDTIGPQGSGYSLYSDVKSSHWASEYIRLASQERWMIGYTDGTFRPEQPVKLEEACAALLRLLGYDSASLAGSFPAAQLNKASAIGLRDGIAARQGQNLIRSDCVQLFYNLLSAKNAGGQPHASALGYSLINGEVDFTSVTVDNLSGPYIAQSASPSLPFTPSTVYVNDKRAADWRINNYDVYYLHEGLGALWIYTDRASGKISSVTPSGLSPSAVVMNGVTYTVGSPSASYKLSVLDGTSTGSTVTLLLGMDGAVVDILTGSEVNSVYYGVIESSSRGVTDEGSAAVQTTVKIICTDGISRTFTGDSFAGYAVGSLAAVFINEGGTEIRALAAERLEGSVNRTGTKLGEYTFAADVEILDTDSEGLAASIEPSRLAGETLYYGDVRYYALDGQGRIKYLILDDVTGDMWTYVYVTEVNDYSGGGVNSSSCTWLSDGTEGGMTVDARSPIGTGGAAIAYNSDGSIRRIKNIQSGSVTQLTSSWAVVNNQQLAIADDVQVYLSQRGSYFKTALSSVNLDEFDLVGCYDAYTGTAGNRVRIIIATPKRS